MKGCHEHQLPSYLDEFMYRERDRGKRPMIVSIQ